MKHISVIVPRGIIIVDTVTGPYNLLKMANRYFRKINGLNDDPFTIELVGLSKEPEVYQRVFQITPQKSINDIERTDLIVVAAIDGDMNKGLQLNEPFVQWIRKQRVENGAEIASLCKGAFLLAETGLANNKNCSTHWTVHEQFKQRYPKVNLLPEKIISEDNGIYSSGGAYSFLNFMLYLIDKFFGRETAIWCSKLSEIEMDRFDQSYFMIFNGQKDHRDEAVKKAQLYIEENYEHKININELADKVGVSARNFLRRFKKATSNTPKEYIARVKVEAAKRQFESTVLNIQEVMLNIGYIDEQAFRNTFRKYSGLSPMAYRKKYNREMAMA